MDWWDNSEKEISRILDEIHEAENEDPQTLSPNEVATAAASEKKIEEKSVLPVSEANEPPKSTVKAAPSPKTDDGVELKGVVKNVAVEKKPVTVYKATRLPGSYMSPDDFITPTYRHRNEVAQRVMMVLNTEGPISETLLTRRVVQSYSIARAGSRIQTFMYSVFKSMNLNSTTQGGERFFWKPSQNPYTYTEFRANGESDNKRDSKDIPVQEAANAVCRALEEQFSLSEEDLIRAAANLMGINRVGAAVTALFLGGIEWAEQTGRIRKAFNNNWVLSVEK